MKRNRRDASRRTAAEQNDSHDQTVYSQNTCHNDGNNIFNDRSWVCDGHSCQTVA
jgi:hypothetical protein